MVTQEEQLQHGTLQSRPFYNLFRGNKLNCPQLLCRGHHFSSLWQSGLPLHKMSASIMTMRVAQKSSTFRMLAAADFAHDTISQLAVWQNLPWQACNDG